MQFTSGAAVLGTVCFIRLLAQWWRKCSGGKPSRPLSDYAHVLDIKRPEAFELKQTPYGLGMFVTRDVKKGDVVYRGQSLLIPDIPGAVLLRDGSDFFLELDVVTHSVLRHNGGKRELYAYDGFMNHSCDPSTTSVDVTADETVYNQVAKRDMQKGDQITCDYETFEWDCKDKAIDNCGCGTAKCRRRVWGYKHIEDRALKVELYSKLGESQRITFHKEEPELAAAIAAEAVSPRAPVFGQDYS